MLRSMQLKGKWWFEALCPSKAKARDNKPFDFIFSHLLASSLARHITLNRLYVSALKQQELNLGNLNFTKFGDGIPSSHQRASRIQCMWTRLQTRDLISGKSNSWLGSKNRQKSRKPVHVCVPSLLISPATYNAIGNLFATLYIPSNVASIQVQSPPIDSLHPPTESRADAQSAKKKPEPPAIPQSQMATLYS